MNQTKSNSAKTGKALDMIARTCNKLPSPFIMFVGLFAIVAVLSAVFSAMGITAVNPADGKEVVVNNFFTKEGITWFLTKMTTNFSGFASLGLVLSMTLGINICEQVGLVDSFLKKSVHGLSGSVLPYAIALIGTCGNLASDTCTVVIPPLAAIAFAGVGRNPIAGLMCGWLAANCGFSANLLIAGTDSLLAGITNTSIKVLQGENPTLVVDSACNWYFMVASTFLITAIVGWCTNHLLEPSLGKYEGEEVISSEPLGEKQLKGLKASGIALVIYVAIILAGIFSGLLTTDDGKIIGSPFLKGLIPIVLGMFLVVGLTYGFSTGYLKNEKDISKAASKAMASMGSFVAFCFTAGQFTALFNWSNIGTIMAVKGADALKAANATGPVLFVAVILLVVVLNLFIGSASAKWTILGPVFVPMFMMLGFHPAFTQLLYRIGDSPSNAISPVSPYLFMCLAVANQKYDKDMKLGDFIAPILPTIGIIQVLWIVFTIIWYLLGLPLGPGAGILMP